MLLEMVEGNGRLRRQVDAVEHAQQPRSDGKDGNRPDEHSHAHAAGPNGGDFAVGGDTAESH